MSASFQDVRLASQPFFNTTNQLPNQQQEKPTYSKQKLLDIYTKMKQDGSFRIDNTAAAVNAARAVDLTDPISVDLLAGSTAASTGLSSPKSTSATMGNYSTMNSVQGTPQQSFASTLNPTNQINGILPLSRLASTNSIINNGNNNNTFSGTTDFMAQTTDPVTTTWFYTDSSGKQQGPFNSSMMQDWFVNGYLADSLLVRRHVDNSWITLGELSSLCKTLPNFEILKSPFNIVLPINLNQIIQPPPLLHSHSLNSFNSSSNIFANPVGDNLQSPFFNNNHSNTNNHWSTTATINNDPNSQSDVTNENALDSRSNSFNPFGAPSLGMTDMLPSLNSINNMNLMTSFNSMSSINQLHPIGGLNNDVVMNSMVNQMMGMNLNDYHGNMNHMTDFNDLLHPMNVPLNDLNSRVNSNVLNTPNMHTSSSVADNFTTNDAASDLKHLNLNNLHLSNLSGLDLSNTGTSQIHDSSILNNIVLPEVDSDGNVSSNLNTEEIKKDEESEGDKEEVTKSKSEEPVKEVSLTRDEQTRIDILNTLKQNQEEVNSVYAEISKIVDIQDRLYNIFESLSKLNPTIEILSKMCSSLSAAVEASNNEFIKQCLVKFTEAKRDEYVKTLKEIYDEIAPIQSDQEKANLESFPEKLIKVMDFSSKHERFWTDLNQAFIEHCKKLKIFLNNKKNYNQSKLLINSLLKSDFMSEAISRGFGVHSLIKTAHSMLVLYKTLADEMENERKYNEVALAAADAAAAALIDEEESKRKTKVAKKQKQVVASASASINVPKVTSSDTKEVPNEPLNELLNDSKNRQVVNAANDFAPWASVSNSFSPTKTLEEIQREEKMRSLEERKKLEEKKKLEESDFLLAAKIARNESSSLSSLITTSNNGKKKVISLNDLHNPKPKLPSNSTWATASVQSNVQMKSLDEIQKEELKFVREQEKALAQIQQQKTLADSLATTLSKSTNSNNDPWTVVNKKQKPVVPTPAAPSNTNSGLVPSSLRSVSSSTKTATPVAKAIPTPTIAHLPPPSVDFLAWARNQLMGLYSSVNKEDVLQIMLQLPMATETQEIIADTVYSNSSTMDGRRFASEFMKRRGKVEEQIKKRSWAFDWNDALKSTVNYNASKNVSGVSANSRSTDDSWDDAFTVVTRKKGRK